jgi:hypothetical protein
MLTIFILLQMKHLLIDWMWQPAYEWKNKGTYGHPGGLIHALKNGLGTALCFAPFVYGYQVPIIFLMDYLIHYHIDWAKMNLNRAYGWGPLTHNEFWWLTGLDQFLHQMTYVMLIWLFLT